MELFEVPSPMVLESMLAAPADTLMAHQIPVVALGPVAVLKRKLLNVLLLILFVPLSENVAKIPIYLQSKVLNIEYAPVPELVA